MKEESKIKSFSINKYNEKKKIFGKPLNMTNSIMIKTNIIKKININDKVNRKNHLHVKIKYDIKDIKNKGKKILHNNRSVKIFKPNCYFNKLNLDKISKKINSNI